MHGSPLANFELCTTSSTRTGTVKARRDLAKLKSSLPLGPRPSSRLLPAPQQHIAATKLHGWLLCLSGSTLDLKGGQSPIVWCVCLCVCVRVCVCVSVYVHVQGSRWLPHLAADLKLQGL